jgi:hypothetical protein
MVVVGEEKVHQSVVSVRYLIKGVERRKVVGRYSIIVPSMLLTLLFDL